MSSMITGILCSTVSLLLNKARDKTAAKLQNGGVTDAKIRQFVVRELSDIKTRLDGLSRKDLLSSYRFLKEGVCLLIACLDQWTQSTQEDRGESSTMSSGVASDVLNEVLELTRAVENIKIESCSEYESDKERFKCARIKATEAFCNEALGIDDRIFAAKLRIVSEILENLESPKTAITGCLSFLQDLHSLPPIREMFSVYLNGGAKSLLGKEERAANVKSVMMINNVLFLFTFQMSRKPTDWLTWRVGIIELADRSFNPVLEWQKVASKKSMGGELGQPPNELVLDEEICPCSSAVNSRGEIVVIHGDDEIKIVSTTGKSRLIKLPERTESNFVMQKISGFAVDKDNNIHFVSYLETRTETDVVASYLLNMVDNSYNVKHSCTLDFLEKKSEHFCIDMTINENNEVIMTCRASGNSVYVCDNSGKLKHKFDPSGSHLLRDISTSIKNEIMIPSHDGKALNFYADDGNVTSTIKLPEGHIVWGVAVHYVFGKIVILSYVRGEKSCFLLYYSEEGKLESSKFFCNVTDLIRPNITSHPGGPVAVVRERSITFI